MRVCLFLLLLPFSLCGEIAWQAEAPKPFAATIQLSSDKVSLDNFLNLKADFSYPTTYQLDLEKMLHQLAWTANPLAPQLSVYQSKIEQRVEEGIQKQHLHAILAPLIPGSLSLTLGSVSFTPKENTESIVTLSTPVFNIEVLPLPQPALSLSPAQLLPLEPQFPLGLTEANRQSLIDGPQRLTEEKEQLQQLLEAHTFPWLTLLTLLACGGIGWVAYLTRSFWPKRPVKPAPALSPVQQANQAFDALQKKNFVQKGLFQPYFAEHANILVTFLQALIPRISSSLTTAEIATGLKDESSLSSTQKQEILALLSHADEVKFAGKASSQAEADQLHRELQSIIQRIGI